MPVRLKETGERPLLVLLCPQHDIPDPQVEYRFHPLRKWRFDYAWTHDKVALEVEGGVWVKGRHNRGSGFLKDMEKYNEASILGWCVIRCTPQDIETGKVFELLRRVL